MDTVKMTFKDGQILVDRDYEFVVSDDTYFSNDLTPYKEVKFTWNLDLVDIVDEADEEEEILNLIGEKFKKDFISFMKMQNQRMHV